MKYLKVFIATSKVIFVTPIDDHTAENFPDRCTEEAQELARLTCKKIILVSEPHHISLPGRTVIEPPHGEPTVVLECRYPKYVDLNGMTRTELAILMRYLPSPANKEQTMILNKIISLFSKSGGWDVTLSKKVG